MFYLKITNLNLVIINYLKIDFTIKMKYLLSKTGVLDYKL